MADGVARGAVSQDTDERLQEFRGPLGGRSEADLGGAGVLSRVQPCQRRPDAGDGSVRRIAVTRKMRKAALEISPEAFRELGHRLVDRIAEHLSRMPDGPVRPDEPVAALRKALDAGRSLPDRGAEPAALLTGA